MDPESQSPFEAGIPTPPDSRHREWTMSQGNYDV